MKIISRPKIGLALGGGGARSLAHIGVIKVLVKNKIPIDFIAGTSAGSLVGGLFAATGDIESIEKLALELNYKDFIKAFSDINIRSGLVKGNKVLNSIEEKIGKHKLENLKIPFSAVSADLVTGKKVVIDKGDLALAIRASCSLPGLFSPIKINNQVLIDGGVIEQVPVISVKKMGADKIIAVNLNHKYFSPSQDNKNKTTPFSVVRSAGEIMLYNIAKRNSKKADIVIYPKVPNISLLKFIKGEKYIRMGEEAALRKINEIKWMSKKKFLFVPIS